MDGYQNDGPFLGPYHNTAPGILGTQKGTPILITTHMLHYTMGMQGLKASDMADIVGRRPVASPNP